jgi:hypothetical protein
MAKEVAIIALTANLIAEDVESCKRRGVTELMAKPVDASALFAALLKWLPKRAPRPAVVQEPAEEVDAAPVGDADPATVRAILEELEPLLISGDASANSVLETWVHVLRNHFGAEALRLEEEIDSYDYGAASERVKALLARLG